jgi:hypothetical protein
MNKAGGDAPALFVHRTFGEGGMGGTSGFIPHIGPELAVYQG